MPISIYAVARSVTETGKYGGTLTEAEEWFLKLCEKHHLKAKIKQRNKDSVHIQLYDKFPYSSQDSEHSYHLLREIATIADIGGEPPMEYALMDRNVAIGEYVKTGSFAD